MVLGVTGDWILEVGAEARVLCLFEIMVKPGAKTSTAKDLKDWWSSGHRRWEQKEKSFLSYGLQTCSAKNPLQKT